MARARTQVEDLVRTGARHKHPHAFETLVRVLAACCEVITTLEEPATARRQVEDLRRRARKPYGLRMHVENWWSSSPVLEALRSGRS